MESFEETILILFDNSGIPNKSQKEEAEKFCKELIQKEDGWYILLEKYSTSKILEVKFWCLQEIQKIFASRYATILDSEKEKIRNLMLDWMKSEELQNESSFLKNKFAHILITILKIDYPNKWPSFFEEIIEVCKANENTLEIFFRVLITIDNDIINLDTNHNTPPKIVKAFKTAVINNNSSENIIKFEEEILMHANNIKKDTIIISLDSTQRFMNWFPMQIIFSQKLILELQALFEYNDEDIKEMILKLFKAIVSRTGFAHKNEMLHIVINLMENCNFIQFFYKWVNGIPGDKGSELRATSADVLSCIAGNMLRLLNTCKRVERQMIENRDMNTGAYTESAKKYQEYLNNLFPILFKIFETDENSETEYVMEFFNNYISSLKGTSSSSNKNQGSTSNRDEVEVKSAEEHAMLLHMLKLVLKAIQYPENSNFQPGSFINENHKAICQEETKVIEERRKVMLKLFRKINYIANAETIAYITDTLNAILMSNSTFQNIEALLLLIHELGQAFSGNNINPSNLNNLRPLICMIMNADIPHSNYIPVAIMFLNVASTYSGIVKSIDTNGECIDYFLKFYLSGKALGSDIQEIVEYSASDFIKFIKQNNKMLMKKDNLMKIFSYLSSHLQAVITNPRLTNTQGQIQNDPRLNLFEASGLIIFQSLTHSGIKDEMKGIGKLLTDQIQANLNIHDVNCQLLTYQAISAMLSFSNGFFNKRISDRASISFVFCDCLENVIMAAKKYVGHKHIMDITLKFFHRMIDLLNDYTLKYVSDMIGCLIYPNCSVEDITNIIRLLIRFMGIHKAKIADFVVITLPDLCNEVFTRLGNDWDTVRTLKSTEVTASAELKEKEEMECAFFDFLCRCFISDIKILNMVNSDVATFIINQLVKASKEHFAMNTRNICMKNWQHIIATWPVEKRSDETFKQFIFYEVCYNICIISGIKFDKNDPASKIFTRQIVDVLKTAINVYSDDIIRYLSNEISAAPFLMSQKQSLIQSISSRDEKMMIKAFRTFVSNESKSS